MIDWDRIRDDLMKMYDYFMGCAVHAAPGSEARKTFSQYMETLTIVTEEIDEMLRGEDDGK